MLKGEQAIRVSQSYSLARTCVIRGGKAGVWFLFSLVLRRAVLHGGYFRSCSIAFVLYVFRASGLLSSSGMRSG
jgi:hypothetical protein